MKEEALAADVAGDTWEGGRQERDLAIVWPLLGRHIAFHRRLVDLTANVKAALLLSQTIYWTRHGRDIASTGGWFVKTTEQWEMETGLSVKEQLGARERLRELALLGEQRRGVPARLHYRLCVDQLAALLAERIGRAGASLDGSEAAAVAELLGPSVAYHRRLAGIAGGVHAGLLLSRALHLTRLQLKRRLDAWVRSSASQWCEEIGLTRREQETARRDLLRVGVWEEAVTGVPPTLVARVRLDCLLALLAEENATAGKEGAAPVSPEGGVPANSLAQNGASRWRESHHLVAPKTPNQIRQNRHHSSPETANLHIQGSTRYSVQPHHAAHEPRDEHRSNRGGDLIFPEALLPEERASALVLVEPFPAQAQALLDELSARMQAKAIRTGPIAYLRGLAQRASTGEFVPELGQRVATARRRRGEDLTERQQREAEERRLAAERATPEYQARLAARREKIRGLFDAIRPKRSPGDRP